MLGPNVSQLYNSVLITHAFKTFSLIAAGANRFTRIKLKYFITFLNRFLNVILSQFLCQEFQNDLYNPLNYDLKC